MNLSYKGLIGAALALLVAVALACKMAQAVRTDDPCHTPGSRSSHQPRSITKKKTVVEALFEFQSQPMQSANGESLLAVSKSLSKVDAAVEDQKGLVGNTQGPTGPERFERDNGTEDVTVAKRVGFAPMNVTAPRPLQSAASRVRHSLQRARRKGSGTLQAAVAQTGHGSSFANIVNRSLQVQATNRSHAQRSAPRPPPAAEVPEIERGPHSSRGPRLPGLLPPLNLAGLGSFWLLLRQNNRTGLGRGMPVSHLGGRVRVAVVPSSIHRNSWLLIAVAAAILLSIYFAWRCFSSSQSGSERLPGLDDMEKEDYSHEAWVLQAASSSGKRSSGNILAQALAMQSASFPPEHARSTSPVPTRNPDVKEPRSRLF